MSRKIHIERVTVLLPVSEKGHVFTYFHFPPLSAVKSLSTLNHGHRSRVLALPSPSMLHSGVLIHSGNDVGMNNRDANNNSTGAADAFKSLLSDATN